MLIKRDNPDFPACLKKVRPTINRLLVKGCWEKSIWQNSISIVGSRRMSSYGKRAVESIVPDLVAADKVVVSGFMYGVDQEAHKKTVELKGRTIAVLGYGIDKEFTRSDERLLMKEILENRGAVVSEYEGKQAAQRWMFAARNRIVAGLGKALLVIEAAVDSGSMITVEHALTSGKLVMAVPGPIFSSVSEGANRLIKEGRAISVTSGRDVLDALGCLKAPKANKTEGLEYTDGLIRLLRDESMEIDQLIRLSGGNTGNVLEKLSELELGGVIVKEGGKYRLS